MGINIEDHFEEIFEVIKLHLLPLMLIFATIVVKKQVKMTAYEKFAFYWFLFNGAIIHITWDGFVGALHQCDPLVRVYSLMDNRYKVKENAVRAISFCELFLHGPLCLYTARLFLSSRGLKRDIFSILASFLQLVFTYVFVYDEYLNNFVNVCPEESCFTFSTPNILFFWICFVFFNPVWILIPLYNIVVAYNNIVAQERWTFNICAIENRSGQNYYDSFDKVQKPVSTKKSKKD
ncbi:hypothetical protein ABPG72_001536 [Tetrahymena utriculariae]